MAYLLCMYIIMKRKHWITELDKLHSHFQRLGYKLVILPAIRNVQHWLLLEWILLDLLWLTRHSEMYLDLPTLEYFFLISFRFFKCQSPWLTYEWWADNFWLRSGLYQCRITSLCRSYSIHTVRISSHHTWKCECSTENDD